MSNVFDGTSLPILSSAKIKDSQDSQMRRLRVLGSQEENLLVDSSLEGGRVDTQQLLALEQTVEAVDDDDIKQSSSSDSKPSDEGTSSSAIFKQLKLPNAESPWLNRIADPFEDTPATDKIKPLKETPIHSKFLYDDNDNSTTSMTPDTISKRVINTPGDIAHKVFDRLRRKQAEPELDIDTQSADVPSLAYDDTQDCLSNQNASLADVDASIAEGDTVADYEANLTNLSNVSQAALQIPGTAPEDDEGSALHSTFNNSTEDIRDNEENASPTPNNNKDDNNRMSSPVVSEDEDGTFSDSTKGNKSSGHLGSFQAEDSLQVVRARDQIHHLTKSSPPQRHSQRGLSIRTNSLPQANSASQKGDEFSMIETPSRQVPAIKAMGSSTVRKSQNPDMVLNITQEFSDIDDESKVNATVEGEDPTVLQQHEDDDDDEVIKRGRKGRKRAFVSVSSQEPKRLKDDQISSSELSALTTRSETNDEDITMELRNVPQSTLEQEPQLFLKESDIVSHKSVWSLYETFYYPGLIVGEDSYGTKVKFNDRVQYVSGVVPLDIRIGDTIQYDDNLYSVMALQRVSASDDVIRCMRGYDTVVVEQVRKKRMKNKNTYKNKKTPQEWRFAIQDIKMSVEEWSKMDRVGSEQELQRRRATRQHSILDQELSLTVPEQTTVKSELFDGCIFALTNLDDSLKAMLEKLILENGGSLAQDGFASLIEYSEEEQRLVARNDPFGSKTFAALITSRTNRYSKFLESLSLGWPVLSYEYLQHCAAQSTLLTNLRSYLLPSGKSKHLHDAMVSADISRFIRNWESGSTLEHQLQNNLILEGKLVLMTEMEPEISTFVFRALGARVRHVKLINDSDILDEYCDEEYVYLYAKSMARIPKSIKSFEAKRRSSQPTINVQHVDWEWLVQCIISGYPWESRVLSI